MITVLCLKAMVAALGNSKDYTLKQYLLFVDKLQDKAKFYGTAMMRKCCLDVLLLFEFELSAEGDVFTPSDVERALWSSAIGAKVEESSNTDTKSSKKKRKR
ncbi:hypothetical protein HanOQP8_Chr08g0289421 [Helianthus annuus]|nr:hypothetical protein HanHA89_Chr08g0300401 [Helianthus annuus]KAJ0719454.1 hypothetical protein HanLR1_Chr08g0281941 [Helianthus annuus]KAJ0722681.1 hypothetical protein HanOQP8_Chr08g0289421 [Helianthus annuus]